MNSIGVTSRCNPKKRVCHRKYRSTAQVKNDISCRHCKILEKYNMIGGKCFQISKVQYAIIIIIGTAKSCMILSAIIMPRCACVSEVYGSVFVCLCVCVECYSCSRINEVQVRVSIGF